MIFELAHFIDPNTIATVASAVFGGAGVELLKRFVTRRSDSFYESSKLREELHKQLDAMRSEMEEWKMEADEWRGKYWEQVEKNTHSISNFEALKAEFDTLKAKINSPRPE